MAQLDLRAASDAELVARFAAGRDQRAFSEVVRRHGPMVMAAARRVLRHEEDAEDAFQATFLALAAACERLRRKTALAAWLHQTALRTARSIGRTNGQWQRKIDRRTEAADESYTMRPPNDQVAVLDEELHRLAPAYRAAILLCDLEGLSRTEAASRLSVPAGTLSARLTRGRRLLRDRLIRRGVTLSAGGLASAMKPTESTAAITPALIEETTTKAALVADGKSVVEIGVSTSVAIATQGVTTTMTLTRFSMIGTAALAVVFAATAVGVLSTFATAGTIFRDNFDDGSATDGSPVRWGFFPGYAGTMDASSGDLVLRPSQSYAVIARVLDLDVQDVSIRTQARILKDTERLDGFSVYARGNLSTGRAYAAGINETGSAYIRRTNLGQLVNYDQVTTNLRPLDEDVVLQFDVFGSTLRLWAWRADEPRPQQPHLTVENREITQAGLVAIGYANAFEPAVDPGDIAFRYVHVADVSIPEPSTATLSAIFFAGVFAWQWHRRW